MEDLRDELLRRLIVAGDAEDRDLMLLLDQLIWDVNRALKGDQRVRVLR